jgi:hypothetical protein
MKDVNQPGPEPKGLKEWKPSDLTHILEALSGLRYGSVELIIQDYRLIQIDRKEKIRYPKN